jgi:CheY-like chemotaxis protein
MPPRILIIEDDAACRELFRYLLHRAGFDVTTAADGAEGLRVAAAEKLELVLCDLWLPVLNGFEVVRRLKARPETASMPVVALTANAMADDREAALAAGFDGYLSKLIEPDAFLADVTSFVAPDRIRRPA